MSETHTEPSRVGWLLALFKAEYLLGLCVALLLWGDLGEFIRLPQRWPQHGSATFASHFAGWDAGYYLILSESGYRAGDSACAFYPLWPLLIRWFSPVMGGSCLISGLFLANVFSLAGGCVFFRIVSQRLGPVAARWSLVFLLAFPGALFFQFVYSEALFFLLLMLLWLGLEQDRQGLACLAALLLPFSRGVGVFAVLPIGWHVLRPAEPWFRTAVEQGFRWLRTDWVPARLRSWLPCSPEDGTAVAVQAHRTFPLAAMPGRAWLIAAPLAGWGGYLVLMGWWTGNPFEGFEAQRYWGVHSIGNLWNLPKFVAGFFNPTEWHAFAGSFLDRCVFLLVLGTIPIIWRLGKDLFLWTVALAIMPAMSGTFTSFTRFAACAFPVFIALGVVLGRPERRWPRYSLLGLFVVFHIVLVWRYVNCRWAG